ncbi:MAG: hypothetical protein EOO43_10200 [Flavobacterium sp.]|nr:MAG: hypothetical protein EOO43_10200 [Flavobacterium sp.]
MKSTKAMRFTDRLQVLTGQIIDDPLLAGEQQEKRIIQAFDLCHFIHCFDPSLEVLDCLYQDINVVEKNGSRKGIYFWDLLYNKNYYFSNSALCQSDLAAYKARYKLTELWFVIVEEGLFSNDTSESTDFIERYKVTSLYDKVFHFNYTHSTVKTLI